MTRKRFFTINIDWDCGEAEVATNDEWGSYNPLLKADILNDAIVDAVLAASGWNDA